MNYILSFEEISLKFISVGEQDALRTFLLRRLDNLTKDDRMQITMISTWATELYLDKINRLLLEDGTGATSNAVADSKDSEYRSIVNEFRAFLSDSKDVLDEATTMRLLERYVVPLLHNMLHWYFRLFKFSYMYCTGNLHIFG
jgi:hypothetical protein